MPRLEAKLDGTLKLDRVFSVSQIQFRGSMLVPLWVFSFVPIGACFQGPTGKVVSPCGQMISYVLILGLVFAASFYLSWALGLFPKN